MSTYKNRLYIPMSEPETANTEPCLNCNQPLTGAFCANCGQEAKEVRRPFFPLIYGALYTIVELDGRAYRTVFSLLTRPGFLTREYFGGRRTSYTPPLRLFLVISIGFFLLVALLGSVNSMRDSLDGTSSADSISANINFSFGSDDDDDETSELNLEEMREIIRAISLPFLSEQSNQNLRTVLVAQAEANIEELLADPQGFLLDALEYITIFMLLMMPLLALIQKILYFFTGRYYVEHLILTLHNHAFLIFAIFLTMVSGTIEDMELVFVSTTFAFIGTALGIWIFVYLYLSLKFYFGRGYFLTGIIFITTSILYSIALSMGIAVFAVLLFILS